MASIQVDSPNVTYADRYIEADYDYCTTSVESTGGKYKVRSLGRPWRPPFSLVRSMRDASLF